MCTIIMKSKNVLPEIQITFLEKFPISCAYKLRIVLNMLHNEW